MVMFAFEGNGVHGHPKEMVSFSLDTVYEERPIDANYTWSTI